MTPTTHATVTTPVAPTPPTERGSRRARWAAAGYTLAWIAGLSVSSSSTDVRSSGAEVLAGLRGQHTAVAVQYLLTEGLTSILLVLAVAQLWRRCRPSVARTVAAAALAVAVAVSFVECALGVALSSGTPSAGGAGTISAAINRLDGAKMLLLAAAVGLACLALEPAARSWRLRALGALTCVGLLTSGVGYATLEPTPAAAAWVSLPLLIVFVLAAAWIRGYSTRPA